MADLNTGMNLQHMKSLLVTSEKNLMNVGSKQRWGRLRTSWPISHRKENQDVRLTR